MVYNGIVGMTIWEMVLVCDCVSMPMHLIMVKSSLYGRPIKRLVLMRKMIILNSIYPELELIVGKE